MIDFHPSLSNPERLSQVIQTSGEISLNENSFFCIKYNCKELPIMKISIVSNSIRMSINTGFVLIVCHLKLITLHKQRKIKAQVLQDGYCVFRKVCVYRSCSYG